IKDENIPVVYYEELRKPTVAESIAADTGAKTLLLHSGHNVTDEEIDNGVSYLSIMQQNAENLKEGLS
ncbi:MAG: zinc ABC transporter substrate-binding protein, partial [Bacillota bacterium]|nr:zinc ABC transporter substrate-binding protein [Bacillota bacterium]